MNLDSYSCFNEVDLSLLSLLFPQRFLTHNLIAKAFLPDFGEAGEGFEDF